MIGKVWFSQTPQHVVHGPLWFLLERADLVGESSIHLINLFKNKKKCVITFSSHLRRFLKLVQQYLY